MFSTIICATDGSAHAERALELAAEIAEEDGAQLHAVHVVERLLQAKMGAQNARLDERSLIETITERVTALAEPRGIPSEVHVLAAPAGHVADDLAALAEQLRADLIVIGTRGHSAIGGVVLGSVTQRLLHVSPCPVLAIPPARPERLAGTADASSGEQAP